MERESIEPIEFAPGLKLRPTIGQNSLANFVSFDPHTEAPMHSHVEEQVVVVLEGELEFTIDTVTRSMRPGDIAVIPPWVPQGAVTLDGACLEVDAFSPPHATIVEHVQLRSAHPKQP